MTVFYLLVDGINPEPWTAPTYSVGRKGGRQFPVATKNPTLRTYQEALAEEVHNLLPKDWEPFSGCFELELFFWRELASYKSDSGRMVTRHRADRSNLLKATEDALQVDMKPESEDRRRALFVNDKQILTGNTTIVAQSKETAPRILIIVRLLDGFYGERCEFASERAHSMFLRGVPFEVLTKPDGEEVP